MKIIFKQAAYIVMAAITFTITSCQKKFDPSSYAPAKSFGGYVSSSQIAPGNLVTHFSFENNLIDSISGTSATNKGTSFSVGVKGNALQGALNSYVEFTATSAIKNMKSMTLSFWINTPQNTTGIQTPVCFVNDSQFWGNFDMFFDGQTTTSSVIKVHAFGNGGTSEAWLTSWSMANPWNAWFHMAVTYDQPTNTFTLYVNGAKVGDATNTNFGDLNFTNVPKLVLGTIQFQTTPSSTSAATAQGWASYVAGAMDELRIYDKALSAKDVNALFQLENLGK